MPDLFSNPYAPIYQALAEVREVFHREGRISDSNAKLDETVKFLSIHFAALTRKLDKAAYAELLNKKAFTVEKLNCAFNNISMQPPFATKAGSIFGPRATTAFESGDENVAYELFNATAAAFKIQTHSAAPLDLLNEAFGHHVRDNFRSHVEDAQYMTPPEVVDFMVAMASEELFGAKRNQDGRDFIMMDPSCGVGSFITAWRKEYDRRAILHPSLPKLVAIGQDKVERMARLSAINLIFASNDKDQIFIGNSILESPIDQFNDQVDLILTNPPFGAKFPLPMIKGGTSSNIPFFSRTTLSQKTIDSELLFIDRYMRLLRPGGYCLAVVPDGVISAKGTAALVRQYVARSARLVAVVELPPVTFAQAGTRTKTAVLAFQKMRANESRRSMIFFGEVEDLGFEVSKRKGVPVKRNEGQNQLTDVLKAYRTHSDLRCDELNREFTAVWRDADPSRVDAWTPRRFKMAGDLERKATAISNYILRPLKDIVDPIPRKRSEPYRQGISYISVLHVIGEGLLDIASVQSYRPITPGIPVLPQDVIISRLNPRIPRVLVVPDLGTKLLCSSEFEVLRPQKNISPYALAFLLMSSVVQDQIKSLTAGTSASHSRVRPEKLYEIQVPWPSDKMKVIFDRNVREYKNASEGLIASMISISNLRSAAILH